VAATLDQLEAVYRSRLTEFRRVAAAIVADVDRGRDAVQEAFVTAVRRRSTFRGDGPLEAWLWRIVLSQPLSDDLRHRQRPTLGRRCSRSRADEVVDHYAEAVKLAAEIAVIVIVFAIPLAVVFAVFVWAARKDGEEDRAVQRRLGMRRRTRMGR
jgi:DNA-directed RNA polymerase specialized sigma24 family protein